MPRNAHRFAIHAQPSKSAAASLRSFPRLTEATLTKPKVVLLLTRDEQLHQLLREALSADGTSIIVKHDMSEAVEAICVHRRKLGLDLLVIDFDEGCHGMTFLSTVTICRRDLPTIVVTSTDRYHAAVVASANHVAACVAKPISAPELRMVVTELGTTKSLPA